MCIVRLPFVLRYGQDTTNVNQIRKSSFSGGTITGMPNNILCAADASAEYHLECYSLQQALDMYGLYGANVEKRSTVRQG